jgi:hypothetical protein
MKRRENHALLWCALGILAIASGPARAQFVGPCFSSSSCFAGAIVVCPAGDGDQLSDQGATIFVTLMSTSGVPMPNVAGADFWLLGCNGGMAVVGASGITDINGQTTITGAIKAGGCDTAHNVVCQGYQFLQNPACTGLECHSIEVRSPDVNGDMVVDLVGFSIWAPSFLEPGAPSCHDFSFDGVVDVVDFSIFGGHYLHPYY